MVSGCDSEAPHPERMAYPDVSFVVRLWLEHRDVSDGPEWRFRARHVQSGTEVHCRALSDVLSFVESCSGLAAPERASLGHPAALEEDR